ALPTWLERFPDRELPSARQVRDHCGQGCPPVAESNVVIADGRFGEVSRQADLHDEPSPGMSCSQNSARSPRSVRPTPWTCISRSRSSIRRILPEIVLGSSANSRPRTRLYGARCSRAWRRIDSAVAASGTCPEASTTYALGTESRIG